MGVPVGVVVVAAGVDLNESHTALDQPPRQHALAAEVPRAVLIKAVQFLEVFRFGVEIDRLGRAHLHLVSQLVAGDARGQRGIVNALAQVATVVLVELVDEHSLLFATHVASILQVQNRRRTAGVHDDALIRRRHITAGPVLGTADGATGAVEHHHVPRQVFVHRAQSVIHPRTHRRPATEDAAGVHHQHRRAVDRRVGGHRVEE